MSVSSSSLVIIINPTGEFLLIQYLAGLSMICLRLALIPLCLVVMVLYRYSWDWYILSQDYDSPQSGDVLRMSGGIVSSRLVLLLEC